MDVRVDNHGSIYLFQLLTPAARKWVKANVISPNYFGMAIVVEHRYAVDIVLGMEKDGLVVDVIRALDN